MGPRVKGEVPTYCDIILAIFLPPLDVYLGYRFKKEFWIDLVLCLLGYIPGIIYALYVLLRKDQPATEPTTAPATQPATEAATEPATEPATYV